MSNPEPNPENEEQLGARLEREHIRPAETFQGKELWPYTRGMKLIYHQIIDNDTRLFRYLAFVWILVKRGGATFKEDSAKHVIPIAWDIDRFRSEIVGFCDSLTDQDEADAERIFESWLKREQETAVKAGAPDGQKESTLKKTEPIPAALLGTEQG